MIYHIWTLDKKRQISRILMNGDGPRVWKNRAGPRAWADRHLEHGTFRSSQCECVPPCPTPEPYIAKYKRV